MQASVLSKKTGARSAAALAIRDVLVHGQSLDSTIARHTAHLPGNDAGLARALSYGVLRHYYSLDAGIAPLLDKPLRNKDKDIHALLLIGALQLSAMRMPAYAAVDSVVRAARELQKPWAGSLVNAILRRWQKSPPALLSTCQASDHPDWLYQAITAAWPASAGAIFAANNSEPPLCLRVNLRRIAREDYMAQLQQAGFTAHAGRFSEAALYLDDKPADITSLPGFADGLFSVQDEAAQLAAGLLDAGPGMHILDACAAPGGKTCHILERLDNQADLLALDIDATRLQRVEQNLARLQLTASIKAADILDVDNWWDGRPFQRILCDAPCSATGVIRRHPDIKLLRQADDIARLAALQQQILQTLWPLLAPGGILLYATCSILPAENSEVIARFLAGTADCTEIAIATDCGIVAAHGRQLLPDPHSHDGFYYAGLKKTG